jgi:type IV secretory pathway VirB10-like protein
MMKRGIVFFIIIIASYAYSYAQNADDIFHFAGNLYINGNNKGAIAEVDRGLSLYPNDPKLSALKEKIKEDEKKQQQNKEQQDKQDKNKDKQNQDKQEQGDQKQDKQDKQDGSENQQDKQDQQKQEQQKQQGQQDEDKNQDEKQKQGKPGEISQDDAARLLKALEEEEKGVLKKVEKEKTKAKRVPAEKEW